MVTTRRSGYPAIDRQMDAGNEENEQEAGSQSEMTHGRDVGNLTDINEENRSRNIQVTSTEVQDQQQDQRDTNMVRLASRIREEFGEVTDEEADLCLNLLKKQMERLRIKEQNEQTSTEEKRVENLVVNVRSSNNQK